MKLRFWGLLIALALAAPAAAQEASFAVNQTEAPSQLSVTAGSGTTIGFKVNLTGEGFTCSEEVQAPVNTTVATTIEQPSPENANVTVSEASKTFPIPAGEYTTTPYSQSTEAQVEVSTASGVSENYTATLELTSTFPGGTYEPCVPNEFPEASSEPAQVQLDVTADEPPEEEEPANETPTNDSGSNGTDGGEASTDEGSSAEEDGIPAPTAALPLALVTAALLSAGRREG